MQTLFKLNHSATCGVIQFCLHASGRIVNSATICGMLNVIHSAQTSSLVPWKRPHEYGLRRQGDGKQQYGVGNY
jgi:hypothetical protein